MVVGSARVEQESLLARTVLAVPLDDIEQEAYAPQYIDGFHHELGVSINGLFDLVSVGFHKAVGCIGIFCECWVCAVLRVL